MTTSETDIISTTTRNVTEDMYARTATYYDFVGPYVSRADVQFFVDEAVKSRGPVLEIGCGTGRVLIPSARAGVNITGLDLSESMLGVCRDKLLEEPEQVQRRVDLVQGDMRNFDLGERFALVTSPFRPFQHLVEVEDQLACLAAVRRHLIPGGRLILDVFNPSVVRMNDPIGVIFGQEAEVSLPDGSKLVRSHRVTKRDLVKQVMTIDLIHDIVWPDGTATQEIYTFEMRSFFRFELEHLLARAGFVLETVYADYDRTPYGSKYPGELIAIAHRD